MNTLHADFTDYPAPLFAQYAALSVLAMIALPLLWQLSASVMAIFVLFWLGRWGMLKLGVSPLSNVALVVLMLLAAVLVFSQLKLLWGRDGGVAFLLMMALLKSFESRRIRDWQVLLLSALFLTVGSLLFSQSIGNAIWVALCLLAVLTCLNLLDGGQWKNAWRQAARGMVFSLPLAVVLFIAVPRLPEPLLRLVPTPAEQATGGLSDILQPGSFSQMVLSNELAFNAVFPDGFLPKNNQLYWRALIMPDFDGHVWRQAKPVYAGRIAEAFVGKNPVHYELLLKDWNGHIPVLDYPVQSDDNTLLFNTATVMVKRSYAQLRRVRVASVLSDRLPERLYRAGEQRYLALPATGNLRTRELAKRLRRESRNNEDFVRRTLAYFTDQQFVYTLHLPRLADSADEVDEFMFSTKKGFCGHYASAFALMMRSAGVPARVVTGYQGGEYNADAKFWQVRSKDAHAWTEVWLPEHQSWLRVDPTTVISARGDGGIDAALPAGEHINIGKLPAWMTRFVAESQFYWQKWVVDFDAGRQNDLFKKLGLGKVGAGSVLLILVLGGSLALLPMLVWWRIRLHRQSHPLADGFLLLKRRLMDDDEKALSMGPQDFLIHLQHSGSLNENLRHLIEEYTSLRYRTDTPPKRAVWAWYRRVRKYRIAKGGAS